MTQGALILAPEGLVLGDREAAFFREANPWAFILFARNFESPEQALRLTSELRDIVGRDAPVLVDQEGGRVQRMGPPHWRQWRPVLGLFDGADEASALEATRLRYRIIADELRAVGIDVNCAPLLDVLAPDGHEIIGNRALGRDPEEVIRRGRAVSEGLKAGGVLPVIKHIPGHGRANADSHEALPVVPTPRAELEAIDFAPFRAMANEALGMTAHVVFEAIDPGNCATLSPECIRVIRKEICFDGLLMTDDLSMNALSGSMTERTKKSIAAGCDVILHCNGELPEMEEIAAAAPRLEGAALRRAERAAAARQTPDPADIHAAVARYESLTGEALNG
ncbi:MAG: beta-N-acetylhexosaminidase [Pseudomonadota bacterium]